MDSRRIPLEGLPSEVFDLVYQHVPRKDLARLSRTSRYFWISTAPHIWNTTVNAIDLISAFPTAVRTKGNGQRAWKPYANNIQCIQRCYTRFAFYAQHVTGVQFTSLGSLYNVDMAQQWRWLNWALDYTASRPFRSKMRTLTLHLDNPKDYTFEGLSWLGLFMSPLLETFRITTGPRTLEMLSSSRGFLMHVSRKILDGCASLKCLDVPSTWLDRPTLAWISEHTSLESLVLRGSFSYNELPNIFLPALRKLEIQDDSITSVEELWETPLVVRLKCVIVSVEHFGRRDSFPQLLQLIAARSTGLEALSIPLPSANFHISLLNNLRSLALQRFALTKALRPGTRCPELLEHIGALWHGLEYLAIPFDVSADDLLSIASKLTRLRHLVTGIMFGDISSSTRAIHTQWRSSPKHELVLWTSSISLDRFEEDLMKPGFDQLAGLLAAAWPGMRLFVESDGMYYECLKKEIASHSQRIVKWELGSNTLGPNARGRIDVKEMWAYIEG
ncbi:hypothetical protein RhiJN_00319 [Ceratobasidium sp. AG-Ba]|nr:hypothetical protein RhiJN_00319 [Ceratobasidium sp. AG-Ba]